MALYSYQLEKHFLGGLIQNPEIFTEVEPFISDRTFHSDVHSVIWSCFKSSYLNHERIDKVLLAQKIKNLGISFKDDIDIFSYIDSISFTQIMPKATIKAAQEVAKLYALREIEKTTDRIKSHINNNANESLDKIVSEVDSIYGEKIGSFDIMREPEELFFDIFDLVEETGNNPKEEIGFKTPYAEFNRLYGGLRGGNIYAVASRAGQGKTTWLNHMGIETGKINNIPVLFLDTEMSSKEIKFRTAANLTGVPLWYLETGNWRKNKDMIEKVRVNLKDLANKNKVYHYYVGNRTVDEVCSIIRRWILKVVGRGKPCIVVYDYLKLTGEKLGQNWAEHQALGEKVNKFKAISVEFDFPFVTAIQLNRTGENAGRKSADVVDDGSAIAQSDRLVWFGTYIGIFRRKTEDEMLIDTPESGTHKLIEIKARYQGRDAAGHQDYILRKFPDGTKKFMRNYINFSIVNFKVEEKGSLKDSIIRQNAAFQVADSDDPNHKVAPIEDETL